MFILCMHQTHNLITPAFKTHCQPIAVVTYKGKHVPFMSPTTQFLSKTLPNLYAQGRNLQHVILCSCGRVRERVRIHMYTMLWCSLWSSLRKKKRIILRTCANMLVGYICPTEWSCTMSKRRGSVLKGYDFIIYHWRFHHCGKPHSIMGMWHEERGN